MYCSTRDTSLRNFYVLNGSGGDTIQYHGGFQTRKLGQSPILVSLTPRQTLWQYGLWSFQTGDTKLESFTLRINIPKGNYWIMSLGLTASCQKVTKFYFQSKSSMLKIIWIFLIFFSLKNTNLGTHFLLLKFLDKINF